MAGQGPFSCQFGLLQNSVGLGRLHFCALSDQLGFEASFGVSSDMLD